MVPKDIASRSDHEIMELVLGKRAMKKVDEFLKESNEKNQPTMPKS